MRRAPALVAAIAALSAHPAAARLVVHGRGYGHGIGMSQYGAYGYALEAHKQYPWILEHYYPGTQLSRTGRHAIRVRLRRARRVTFCAASRAIDARGRRVRLHQDRSYTVSSRHGLLRFRDDTAHRTKATLHSPVKVLAGRDFCISDRTDNGIRGGAYRGELILSASGHAVLAVNRLGVEHYLYAVVASEMPSGWPFAALEAQAVASRTYALGARRPDAPYDVFSDQRSQMYRGIRGETLRAVEAVRATSRRVVCYDGHFAQTYFFSTSGGRTAAIDQVWDVPPVPYLQPVSDPYDRLSPMHTWTLRFRRRSAQKRLAHRLRGRLRSVKVISRSPVGRVKSIRLVGTRGTTDLSGADFRRLLGLPSTWFRVRGP